MSAAEGIELRDVTAGYGNRVALRDVSLAVAPGEVVGLVGPNGSGKTTAVRVLSRALRPGAGQVRVAGRDPYRIAARDAARLVAVVPQEMAATFEFTALEVVLLGRTPYLSATGRGASGDHARARRAMEDAGVAHLADRPVGELSGGEKQRVVLAQALAQEAPILILDEPTSHLDLRHVLDILAVVRRLAAEGTAVLAVFHDLNLAAASCRRLVALRDGGVVAEGAPEAVLTPSFLRDTYGVEADVRPDALTGVPAVRIAPASAAAATAGRPTVHVVGGAGRGARLMRSLVERGYRVTAGVLHASDTDAEVAEALNLSRVVVPPFSEVDDAAEAEVLELMRRSDAVVVADAPYGPGNLGNLRAVARSLEEGCRVLLVDEVPIRDRDFADGRATDLWERIAVGAERKGSYEGALATFASGAG